MELKVYNINGSETGRTVVLDDSIFAIEPNDHAIYLDVKQYLANQRQGTHKSKERSEVSGSTRKLGRQKGGGGARRGDINSPLLVGGGRVFGPRPRDYRFKLNIKLKRLARRSALSYKAAENNITVVENFTMEAPKTKKMVEIMTIKKYTQNNFENEAREKRYNFYEKILKKYNSKHLFLAHHGDDLIETILMKIK